MKPYTTSLIRLVLVALTLISGTVLLDSNSKAATLSPIPPAEECRALPQDTPAQKLEKATCLRSIAVEALNGDLCQPVRELDAEQGIVCFDETTFRERFLKRCQSSYPDHAAKCTLSRTQCRFASYNYVNEADYDACFDILGRQTNTYQMCRTEECRNLVPQQIEATKPKSCAALVEGEQHGSVERRAVRRNECLFDTAVQLQDRTVCQAISDNTLRQQCSTHTPSSVLHPAGTGSHRGWITSLIAFTIGAVLVLLGMQWQQARQRPRLSVDAPSYKKYFAYTGMVGSAAALYFALSAGILPFVTLKGISLSSRTSEIFLEALQSAALFLGWYIIPPLAVMYFAHRLLYLQRHTRHYKQRLVLVALSVFALTSLGPTLVNAGWYAYQEYQEPPSPINCPACDTFYDDTVEPPWNSFTYFLIALHFLDILASALLISVVTTFALVIVSKSARWQWLLRLTHSLPGILIGLGAGAVAIYLILFAHHWSSCGLAVPSLTWLDNGSATGECLAVKAAAVNAPHVCEMGDLFDTSYCYADLARYKNDASLCRTIPDQVVDLRDNCIKWIQQKRPL